MFLQIKHLSKHYGPIKAVDAIDLNIQQGELVGLLGPNGAGKSTAISMVATLVVPTQGSIEYKGHNIIRHPREMQKCLGLVPQDLALYPTLSGMDNLLFWGQAYGLKGKVLRQRIEEVSQIIGITDKLKQQVGTYSGGMKRRLNIGTAILHQPELLIMDEPTVGIDPQSRHHILEAVKGFNAKGMTVIYTSHYMEEVQYLCDVIHIMDHGRIISSGSKASLLAKHNSLEDVFLELTGKALRD